MFLKIEFSDKSAIKNLSHHQSQEAKVIHDRLSSIISGKTGNTRSNRVDQTLQNVVSPEQDHMFVACKTSSLLEG